VRRGTLEDGDGAGSEVIVLTADARARPAAFDPAATAPPASTVDAIFVYGTLLEGEALHGHLPRHGPPVPATVRGTLVSLGWYPGLLLDPPGVVHGEVYRLADPGDALARLDEIEEFHGFDAADSLYHRRLVQTAAGLAWIYVLAHDPQRGVPIPSGDWRARD